MKKTLNVFIRILSALILLFAIFVMVFTVISVNTLGKDASLLGYKPYIVRSDSMQGVFSAGDLTVSKAVDPTELESGDIITFKSIDPEIYGQEVTHMIREITEYQGQSAFVTYGIATGTDDAYPVPFDNVVGEYQFRLPKMGYFFDFLRTPAGYVTVILLPFLLLIGLQAARFFSLLRQYRAQQQAELTEQMNRLEAERRENLRIKAELEQLRAQMGLTAAAEQGKNRTGGEGS